MSRARSRGGIAGPRDRGGSAIASREELRSGGTPGPAIVALPVARGVAGVEPSTDGAEANAVVDEFRCDDSGSGVDSGAGGGGCTPSRSSRWLGNLNFNL